MPSCDQVWGSSKLLSLEPEMLITVYYNPSANNHAYFFHGSFWYALSKPKATRRPFTELSLYGKSDEVSWLQTHLTNDLRSRIGSRANTRDPILDDVSLTGHSKVGDDQRLSMKVLRGGKGI